MKLHLPKQLFTALLTVFTLTTVASGEIVKETVSLYINPTTGEITTEATGDFTATNVTMLTGSASNGMAGSNLTTNAGDTLLGFQLTNTTATAAPSTSWFNGTQTITQDVLIYDHDTTDDTKEGLIITNGNSGNVITFAGTVWGNGDFWKRNAPTVHFTFSGDMSKYSGNMTIEGGAITLTFDHNQSGTGTISGNTTTVNVNGATMNNSAISVSKINVSGNSTFTGTVSTNTLTIASGSEVSFAKNLTISGSIENNGTMTMGEGAGIFVSSLGEFERTLISDSFTTSGFQEVAILYSLYTGNAISGVSSITYGNETKELNDKGQFAASQTAFAVAENDTVTVGSNNATAGTNTATVFALSNTGTLVFADTQTGNLVKEVVGNGRVEVTLQASGNHSRGVKLSKGFCGTLAVNNGWMDLTTFTTAADATLELHAGQHWSNGGTVTQAIKLLAENANDYVFRNSGSLTLAGKVTGKYLDLGTTVSNGGTLILSGQGNEIEYVTIGTMNLTIAEDMTFTRVTANNSEYTVSLNAGKTMTLNGGTTEGDKASTISKLTTGSGSTVVLNSGANLTLSSVSGVNGKIIGDGTLTLNTMSTMSTTERGIPALFAGTLNELVLTGSGTCLEITASGEKDEFNNIKNLVIQNGATFSNRLTNQTIGSAEHTLTISGSGAGTTDSVAALAFGRETTYTDAMTMSHTVHLADDATVWVNNARKGILTGTVNGADHVLTKTGSGELELRGKVINTSLAVNAGILKLSGTTTTSESVVVNGGTLKLGSNATLTAGDVQISQQNAELSNVTVQGSSITATSTENGAKGSISNAQLTQLAQDASFTIQDMTLTNTTITAATTETRVNLNNVSGNATLATGTFALQMQAAAPNVGMGGASLSYGVAGTPSLTLGATGAKLVISADPSADVNGIYSDYTLTFNLNVNLTSMPQDVDAWKKLVGFEGWLGTMLDNQNATYQVADGAAQVADAGSVPTVSYGYTSTGGNVGKLVITISGLNVPEPTTATLSLLALAALAARRRRK